MSNVKSGDLAITFGLRTDNGLLVEVLAPYTPTAFDSPAMCGPFWLVRSLGSPFHTALGLRQVAGWPDSNLKHIDSPGEHERDEMLRPLPVEDLDIAHA